MKNEINPGVAVAIIVVLLILIGGFFYFRSSTGSQDPGTKFAVMGQGGKMRPMGPAGRPANAPGNAAGAQ